MRVFGTLFLVEERWVDIDRPRQDGSIPPQVLANPMKPQLS